jgi:hypothetical protein
MKYIILILEINLFTIVNDNSIVIEDNNWFFEENFMVVENIEEEKSNNIKNEIYMVMNYYE